MEEVYEMDYTGIQKNYLPIGDMRTSEGIHIRLTDDLYEEDDSGCLQNFIPGSKKYYDKCLNLMDRYVFKHKGEIFAIFNMHRGLAEIQVRARNLIVKDTEDVKSLSYILQHASQIMPMKDNDYQGIYVTVKCFKRDDGDEK
ncbi:MAG: hypothetical protein IJX80_06135 [Clostridia bacterium]|nr:hypothetical protein [Clostridia bacterium]